MLELKRAPLAQIGCEAINSQRIVQPVSLKEVGAKITN